MLINLKELASGRESEITFDYNMDLSEEEVNFDRPFKNPVRVWGRVADTGVLVFEAHVNTVMKPRCARCGREFEREKDLDIRFILSRSDKDSDTDDIFVVRSDHLETDDIVVPELILSMDMAEYCDPDCKGVCFRCGKNLNDGPCDCEEGQLKFEDE